VMKNQKFINTKGNHVAVVHADGDYYK